MYDIHALINEMGARLESDERYEAMVLLNNLYLQGVSDIWICIALWRVLEKGSFNQWKYLLQYDEFKKENDYLEKQFISIPENKKLEELDRAIGFNRDIDISEEEIEYLNENYIYPSWNNELYYEEAKEEIEYYFMKYHYLNSIPYTLKYLFRGTYERGNADFSFS